MAQNNAQNIQVPNVINLINLNFYLSNYNDGKKLSKEEIDKIYNYLESKRIAVSNKEHIQHINHTKNNLENRICPRCKGKIILREGKYGVFFGCENYPNCKFTTKAYPKK